MGEDDERYVECGGNRYLLMTLPHFRRFRNLALSSDSAWKTHYSDSVLKVESKPPDDDSTNLNIIRATRIMKNVSPGVLYNQLHDAKYRTTWDTNMLEGYNIAQLDKHNDIGYYAAKFPWPLSNRDFCNMRSWMEFTNGEYIIFNHSEPHPACPVKKGFVRARSILSGFYIRPIAGEGGTELLYVSHSDPCGSIPHSVINFAMTKGAGMILDNCEKYSETYPAYVARTYPVDYVYPWSTPKMDWDSPYLYPEDVPPNKEPETEHQNLDTDDGPDEKGEVNGRSCEEKPAPFLSCSAGPWSTSLSLAPVASYRITDLLSVQRYRSIMQDAMNAVDRSFLREGRAPTTREYILRLKYIIEGIRQTTVDV
ncbi:hypothetical protein, conserved [Leishmania tarentolae]|uniref:START domain-containing protein 10 n=1 Tax=Leishmania tarentolae TaxID=5689 RepID=A0A640KLH2_LEITA|nr:hypothetical protein, conserved [Leishmania tarentolae]